MAYDKIAADALSNNWRIYCLSLDDASRLQMIASMTAASSVKSERNVRLWYDTGTSYRKILNRTLSSDEYDLRESIIKAALRINNENVPLKTSTGRDNRASNADKFARNVKDAYVGRFIRAVTFNPDGYSLFYDSYGTAVIDDTEGDDEDYIEFTEDLLPDEIIADYF